MSAALVRSIAVACSRRRRPLERRAACCTCWCAIGRYRSKKCPKEKCDCEAGCRDECHSCREGTRRRHLWTPKARTPAAHAGHKLTVRACCASDSDARAQRCSASAPELHCASVLRLGRSESCRVKSRIGIAWILGAAMTLPASGLAAPAASQQSRDVV